MCDSLTTTCAIVLHSDSIKTVSYRSNSQHTNTILYLDSPTVRLIGFLLSN